MNCVIYPTSSGIAVIHPAGDLSVHDVARKDVPAGVPYRIIDRSELPPSREFRNAWTADFSSPDGYGVGNDAWFAERSGGHQ